MKVWRITILFICLLLMFASLYFSRAVLSISMIVFAVVSFLHKEPFRQLKNFISQPVLWSMSLLFFLPVISGLWSEDQSSWLEIVQLKLPLFFLPLAFASPLNFTAVQRDLALIFFILLVLAGTAWSMYIYTGDIKSINESYLRAKSILTPLENDHIRFSWMVNAGILVAVWYWHKGKTAFKIFYWLLPIIIGWFIIYLHILAARTGLVALYMGLLILFGWMIIRKQEKKFWIALLILPLFPVAAYFSFPTFQNRVKYFMYEKEYLRSSGYLPGANDVVRLISLKAGWSLMNQNPLTGTGAGDLKRETDSWYGKNYPQIIAGDKIYPSSEWLMHGAAYGWPGLTIFTIVIIIPFFARVRHRLAWWILLSALGFSLVFDIGLSVQFGILLYAVCILYSWMCLKQEKM